MDLVIDPLPIEPSFCIFCKKGRGADFYVSTGLHGPVGYLFICSNCFSEMAAAIGFKHISSVDSAILDLERKLEQTQLRLETHELLVDTLRNNGIDLSNLVRLVSDEAAIARAIRAEEARRRREDAAKQLAREQESGSSIYSPSAFTPNI